MDYHCCCFVLKIETNQPLDMPINQKKAHNYFLYAPLDKDLKNYSKDSVVYLTDDCFHCDNIVVEKMDTFFIYQIPVRFVKDKDSNPIEFDKNEIIEYLNNNDYLECKIIYTKMYGYTKFSNSFQIPSKDLKNVLLK